VSVSFERVEPVEVGEPGETTVGAGQTQPVFDGESGHMGVRDVVGPEPRDS
jgi:hypothetical protein